MNRASAAQLAALLAPLGAVAIARMALDGGPIAAAGAQTEPLRAREETDAGNAPLTADQMAALTWARAQKLDPAISSPLARPPEPEPEPDPEPELQPQLRPHPTAGLVVSVIIGDGESGVAKINGRLYQLGDEVVSGWFVTDLRPREQEVELANTSGEIVALTRSRP